MNAQARYTVIGRGISPKGVEVTLIVNEVPASTPQEAARLAVQHWTKNGARDAQAHKAQVTSL